MYEIRPRVIGVCAIQVGEVDVTPAASHLFALLLTFALAPREQWTRRGLQDLLFADADERQASHRLRQLLYRLRGYGVVLQESSTGALRMLNPVGDPLAEADEAIFSPTVWNRAVTDPLALYAPRLPAPFLDWLEQRRDALRALLAARRVGQLRAARERQDWIICLRLAESMRVEDPASEDAAVALAEGYAMLGRREAALEAIDLFVRENGTAPDAWPTLRRLRGRVLAARIPRHEGILRGREECVAVLDDQWERAKRDAGGRVTVVFGPAGMGKTRVGETFVASKRLGGGQVMVHRCDAQSRDVPLALFTHLVPELRRRRGSIGADPVLSRALDYLCVDDVSPVEAASPESRRDEVRRAIVDLIESVSAEQPLLVVVDDAHLLDDPSRAVLRALVEGRNSAHVLVILLARQRPDGHALVSGSPRFTSYILPPLDEQQSRLLIAEIATHRDLREAEVEWALGQAAGNPFYLHALARHPCDGVALPAHVRSVAQSSYLGVSPEARTVFDACLLLHLHATPARVTRVAGVSVSVLLRALRELEDADLLRFEQGVLVGPHAIMREALAELMPSTTRALLHHQIAELLTGECADADRARVIAWPAVSSWLACGEIAAAVALALRVARASAAVGEPEAGAVLLDQLPRESLPMGLRREVLDEISVMAEAGKCLPILVRALRDRTQLAVQAQEGATAIASLQLLTTMQEQVNGGLADDGTLLSILDDPRLGYATKIEAAVRLLTLADVHFDQSLAVRTMNYLEHNAALATLPDQSLLRAQLIYHTTFGDTGTAKQIIDTLLALYPDISEDAECRRTSFYAVFALQRLGLYRESASLAERYRSAMAKANHLLLEEFFACCAIESNIYLGFVDRAKEVYQAMRSTQSTHEATDDSHSTGMYAVEVMLSMADQNSNRAQAFIDQARSETTSIFSAARFRAVVLSHSITNSLLRKDEYLSNDDVRELTELFERGRAYGAQDRVAEALWLAHVHVGQRERATELLREYWQVRRELGKPDVGLLASTSSDPMWRTNQHSSHG